MKTVPTTRISLTAACLSLCLLLCIPASPMATVSGEPGHAFHAARYLVLVTKVQNNKKHKIRLYSNDSEEQLLFSVNGPEGRTYQLYLFDMDGHMVVQTKSQNHETQAVNGISKGNYLFEVFSDDEQVESGQLLIK